ncbi:MAG: hypothetical protein AAF614_39765, partial [Chloroflexota bacterium]
STDHEELYAIACCVVVDASGKFYPATGLNTKLQGNLITELMNGELHESHIEEFILSQNQNIANPYQQLVKLALKNMNSK